MSPTPRLRPVAIAATTAGLLALALNPANASGAAVRSSEDPTARTAVAETPKPASPLGDTSAEPLPAGRYVVLLKDQPSSTYTGGVSGYARTAPADGQSFAPEAPATVRYEQRLAAEQRAVRTRNGVDEPIYTWTTALNGFAVELTADEATRLQTDPSVVSITPETQLQLDTSESPAYLGLSGKNGLWDKLAPGYSKGPMKGKGPGMGLTIGVIDSGIRPESKSFADRGLPKPARFSGECVTEDEARFPKSSCTNKLVGARFFVEGFGRNRLAEGESLSALDVGGHGTHTASTAAGNNGVDAVIGGTSHGTISGMAPDASVAAYKICWDGADGKNSCSNMDAVAAIDAAVKDGVDVINYSISGSRTSFIDPVEIAFLNAATANIFIAASSGNSGPTPSTTAHPSPWLTTVAASTHSIKEATLVTGNGKRYIGASLNTRMKASLPSAPLVYAGDIAAQGKDAKNAALCLPDTLDASKAAGKIVICDRGTNARTEKSEVVKAAGGVGMVLVNVTESSLDPDLHVIPTIHLPHTVRDELIAYARSAGATAAMEATNEGTTTRVPVVAGFSSRGPSLAGASNDPDAPGGALLKPDVSAPGVGVLAAWSPDSNGRNFDYVSGTSMSSPHIAGLGLLLKQAHPTWSVMAIKSAMMTTALPHVGKDADDPFAVGAGFVNPRQFTDPGLVYDSTPKDWWNFLAGQGIARGGVPVSDTPIKPYDLNYPSVSVGQLVGDVVVKRTVTNVGRTATSYSAKIDGLPGIETSVTPRVVTLNVGESKTFEIRMKRGSAALYEWSKGALTLSDVNGGHVVRSPIVVRPTPLEITGDLALPAGTTTFSVKVKAGSDLTLTPSVRGLVPGTVVPGTAKQNGSETFTPGDERNFTTPLTVPSGVNRVRVQTKLPAGATDDVDVFVTTKSGMLQGSGSTASGNETIDFGYLPSGEYVVHVQVYHATDASKPVPFDVRTFVLPSRDKGNVTFDPKTLTLKAGQTGVLKGTASVDATKPWFGTIQWNSSIGTKMPASLISIG